MIPVEYQSHHERITEKNIFTSSFQRGEGKCLSFVCYLNATRASRTPQDQMYSREQYGLSHLFSFIVSGIMVSHELLSFCDVLKERPVE